MKEKILAAIKAKFPKVNLSKKRLDAIAAFIEKKVIDDETKIDAAIDEYNDFNPLVELAKQDDTIRDLQAKVKNSAPANKDNDDQKPKADDEPVKTPDDAPEWAKALLKQNEAFVSRLAKIETDKTLGSRKTQLEAKLDKVPEKLKGKILKDFEKMNFKDDEEFLTYLTETETDVAEFQQDETNDKLSRTPKPTVPKNTNKKDEATKEEVDAVVKNIM
jgi:hypothetical protein